MVVQHNLTAMNANRMLGITTGNLSKSAEKLSSGYKVNRAADDAAGLSISEKMRKQIRGLSQASLNAEDGISAVQTAEGALTEVHDMLQRMNELAVKAANGTNSISDRQTIQDEVSQLLTEIDRVAETTKFNEMYLLKGDTDTKVKYLNAKDAGLDGKLADGATIATFTMKELKLGDTVSIGGKEYNIGATEADGGITQIQATIDNASAGELITVDGVQYTVVDDPDQENTAKNMLTKDKIKDLVKEQSSVLYNGKTYHVMKDGGSDGVDDVDASIITAGHAYDLIEQELKIANSVGADEQPASIPNRALVGDEMVFSINKGQYSVKEQLNFSLHVGADADMNNKINVSIDALNTNGLGIYGLNVKDSTGASATYAIDAISDAIAHVSAQRSTLGAIQNRLEHTIKNLDNIVENTTAAESQIRDTDMATEMVKYSNNNILAQAGQSMLAQANQSNQGVLSLLG